MDANDTTPAAETLTEHRVTLNCAVYGEGAKDRVLLVQLDNLFGDVVYAWRWGQWRKDSVRPGVEKRAIAIARKMRDAT
jgi:hypothetical protein